MKGMIETEIWTLSQTGPGKSVLLRLRETGTAIPLFIDDTEFTALLRAYEGPGSGRPCTHDLLVNFIRQSGFVLLRTELHKIKDGIFHARLVFSGGTYTETAPLALDALPSDALVLSIRTGCPLYVSRTVAGLAGVPEGIFLEELGVKENEQAEKNRDMLILLDRNKRKKSKG